MNYTYHYFGAYLRVEVKRVSGVVRLKECPNGHTEHGAYCSECGGIVEEFEREEMVFPTDIDDIVGGEFMDELCVITPPSMLGGGVILAKGNFPEFQVEDSDEWLHLSPHGKSEEVAEFPTPAEIAKMAKAFYSNYTKVITAIRQSPIVKSAVVKTGYVLDK